MTFRARPILSLLICGVLAACNHEEEQPLDLQTSAITVPSGFIEETFASGLTAPTAMAFSPDGRLFVAEQKGTLRVVQNGSLLASPFISLTVDQQGERGLLGLAFHPQFSTNGFIYLYYTTPSPSVHNRLSRFTASGNAVVPGSEVVLLELDNLSSATNHNGGAIHFGSDGKLYVAVGDNASSSNAQTLGNLHGKMLRLNADGSIPTDNPFFNTASGNRRSIWAWGLRNPFTFAVQPGTGTIFINDVGEVTFEEINLGVAGANYGWPATEGATSDPRFRSPLHAYGHGRSDTTGCAITGGAFYNPATAQFPDAYVGKYFFAEYCSNWIRVYDPATSSASGFATATSSGPVDLQVGPDGALYYASRNPGRVARIRFAAAPQAPSITAQPQSQTRAAGTTATFTVGATGTGPLTYQWQRNGTNISGATSSTYTTAELTTNDSGATFRVIVSNSVGSATSTAATLTVTSNTAPTANITSPVQGTSYAAGTTITYAGTASDSQDGSLGATSFQWDVVFHHDTHTHPFLGPITGSTGGSFVVPNRGETAANVFYRIHLTVTDSAGATSTSFRDIVPRVADITLATDPEGLQVMLEGQPVTTPFTTASVVGMIRRIGVDSTQTQNGTSYSFASWSDGGADTHEITTPANAATYQARFNAGAGEGLRGLYAEYFDNLDFTGSKLVRTDGTVDFNWASGSPDASVAADTFSVRWKGTVTPRFNELYRFYTVSDDGVRLWVNGVLIIDNWTNHAAIENSGTITLAAGQPYDIRMDYYENGGQAVARLLWSSASEPKQVVPQAQLQANVPSGLLGTYFDNVDFTNPKLSRTDATLDFNWGTSSPHASLGADEFSVRWTGTLTPPTSETYTIFTTSDDGIRVWIGGQLVINNFTDHAPTENEGSIALTAAQSYNVKVEYYERRGGAVARLLWQSPTIAKQPIPSERLAP